MGLQSPSIPSVLHLVLPLGPQCSVQWLAMSICIYIEQVLVETLSKQPYQAPVSKYFLTTTIVSGFGVCIWGESLGVCVWGGVSLDALSFIFCSIFVPVFPLDRNKILRWFGGLIPQLGPIYSRWTL